MIAIIRWNKTVILAAAVAALLLSPGASFANENLREPLSRIAKAVARVLQDRGANSIAIGEFTGPPSFASAAGPGMRKILAEEFGKVGISEKKIGANVGIQGKYIVHEDPPAFAGGTKGDPRLRIIASLVDQNGQVLSEMNVDVTVKIGTDEAGKPITDKTKISKGTVTVDTFGGMADLGGKGLLAEALGATVDLKKQPPPGVVDGSGLVIDSFQHPSAVLMAGNTAVAASRESPFHMEILVGGAPHAMRLDGGQPFVDLMKDDHFQIRFTNRAPYDAAVVFLLDGVNSFAFSDIRETQGPDRGAPKYKKWVVGRGQSLTLKGWHRTNEYVDKFLVTDFADSAAAKLGSSTGLGTITASVRASWRQGEKPPLDEPRAFGLQLGVGRGGRDTQRVQEDTDPREYGQTRAVITVRYDKPD